VYGDDALYIVLGVLGGLLVLLLAVLLGMK